MEPGFTFVHISCSSIFNCRIFCYLHQQQKNKKNPRKKPRRKYIVMSSDTKRTDKITHYLYWPTFIKILLTNLLYYDYKCLCLINLLAGHYGIYGALIQGIMEKKWSIMKKMAPNYNTLTWVLLLSFLTKHRHCFKKQKTGDFARIVMSEIDWISIRHRVQRSVGQMARMCCTSISLYRGIYLFQKWRMSEGT